MRGEEFRSLSSQKRVLEAQLPKRKASMPGPCPPKAGQEKDPAPYEDCLKFPTKGSKPPLFPHTEPRDSTECREIEVSGFLGPLGRHVSRD